MLGSRCEADAKADETWSLLIGRPRCVVYNPGEDRERWRAMWRAWEASAREDWSAWGKFEPLASSGRTIYASRKNPPPDHLHDLLGAEVEIVRVLPEGTQIKHRSWLAPTR